MTMSSICEENQQTSVLLVTVAAQGHINPMLRLGNLLASKGLHVTLTTNDPALKSRSSTVGAVHLEYFSDGIPPDHNRQSGDFDFAMNTITKFGPKNLSTLIQTHTRKFACIVNTPFVPWVADVAAEFSLPCAMVWIQPCTVYHIYNCFYNRLNEFPTENNMSVSLPGLPPMSTEELPSFVLPTNTFRSFDKILEEVFHNLHKVKWMLGNTFMELEKDVINSVNETGNLFLPVGPFVPATLFGKDENINGDFKGVNQFKSGKNNERDCLKWLDTQQLQSVVYISFGSLIFSSEKQIESIVSGLKISKRPFLWVVKLPENQETEQFGILEEIKEQGLIVRWSPQTAVLSHPSVGCFLSHCGWNSLIESVTAGVPVIACPQWTDQPTNAKLVTDVWGVGVKLNKNVEGIFDGEEMAKCVEEIMSGTRSEKFRKNAAELKRAARGAVADGGSSDKNIQLFVDVISNCS